MSVKRSAASSAAATPSVSARPAQSGGRVRNPQGQGGRLRDELIAAADRILAETGDVEGLSLRAVARAVGIATPSIYLHFPDKAALVRAVLTVRFAELGDEIKVAISQASGPAAYMQAGCLAYCRFAMKHPNAYRVLFGRRPTQPARREPVHEEESRDASPTATLSEGENGTPVASPGRTGASDAVPATIGEHELTDTSQAPAGGFTGAATFSFLVEGVRACMEGGVIPPGDAFRVAVNIWTALHGIVSLRSMAPDFPWAPLEQQVDDVLAGLAGLHHNRPAGGE